MNIIFAKINDLFKFIVPISDFMWEFPTNFSWYANIPLLGKFPLSLFLLLGAGVIFTWKLKLLQVRSFVTSIKQLSDRKSREIGLSPWAAFLLSSAMRVGPGNIIGVTGAIAIGGPGALFWMWVSAFFGMATAYVESVLSQIFKEKDNSEYVGGLPYYARALLGGKVWIGNLVSIILITTFLMNVPSQTFHLYTALGSVVSVVTGVEYGRDSAVYYIIAILLLIAVPTIIFGGVRRVTRVTGKLVPIMAVTYCLMICVIILYNFKLIPLFFTEVFAGAFAPKAIFGGILGIIVIQGVKRGLMSNEAGQGTLTIPAATSDDMHPCQQGFIQSIAVFLDTMIINTLTGFLIVMACIWTGYSDLEWSIMNQDKLGVYMESINQLVPQQMLATIVQFTVAFSYALFAFTTLLAFITFAEISTSRISRSKKLKNIIRIIGSFVLVSFGCLTVLAGLQLGNLWYISDFTNILLVFVNVPVILAGFKLVKRATDHYYEAKGGKFKSLDVLKIKTDAWK